MSTVLDSFQTCSDRVVGTGGQFVLVGCPEVSVQTYDFCVEVYVLFKPSGFWLLSAADFRFWESICLITR